MIARTPGAAMNLVFRLLLLRILTAFRPRCDPFGPCRTPFRVVPTDLDPLMHMNNGIYFSLLDLARIDLMFRSGMVARMRRAGIYVVVAAETMRFRKSLRLWQRFEIETSIVGWDHSAFFVLHRMFRPGDELVNEAVVRARFLRRRGGGVSPAELLALMGRTADPAPALPAWILAWSAQSSGAASYGIPSPPSAATGFDVTDSS